MYILYKYYVLLVSELTEQIGVRTLLIYTNYKFKALHILRNNKNIYTRIHELQIAKSLFHSLILHRHVRHCLVGTI